MGDSDEYKQVPDYGLKLKLNHKYPEKRTPHYVPRIGQILAFLTLLIRYIIYYIRCKLTRKSIVMDYLYLLESKQIYGVPLGGLGGGTIGRGYRGEFCRFQLKPGIYEYNTVEANQFIVTIKDHDQKTIFQSLLSTFQKQSLGCWESLIDASRCTYTGLYPRSWTEYDLSEHGIILTCRQISPVIPGDYQDSSLPCAVFVWSVKNICDKNRTVTIAFTFKNGTGNRAQDKNSISASKSLSFHNIEGVILYHTIDKTPCSYSLAAKSSETVSVSKCLYFDPNSDGSKPWFQLRHNGRFDKVASKYPGHVFGEMACGIAAKVTVAPGNPQTDDIEMCLAWDMPKVFFPGKQKCYNRYYTKFFSKDSSQNILKIVLHIFNRYSFWEKSIYEWQKPVLDDVTLPSWYKSALFNESYYLSDGGTIWATIDEEEAKTLPIDDPRRNVGRFAYLEGHEYKMYNSYDVHFYASFALFTNWPLLQYSLQYDLRDSIFLQVPIKVKMLYDGRVVERKVANTVPHDIGDPGEEPFLLPNSYPIQDVSKWRDLGTKFVLQVFRDAFSGKDKSQVDLKYLGDLYDACYTVMCTMETFDLDGDGLIENQGSDQTFDTWIMKGASAYCGGLWLAALFAMTEITKNLNKSEDNKKFQDLLNKATQAYDQKLWNGKYYNFDCSKDEYKSIMADQLCGHWYLKCTGYNYEVFAKDKVASSLQTIYKNNVLSYFDGQIGAVNGFINGGADPFTLQSEEVWTGITYALASHLIHEGMVEEGFKTAGGMYRTLTECGLAFDTPESLLAERYFRSISYMRPLAVWSIQLALEHLKKSRQN